MGDPWENIPGGGLPWVATDDGGHLVTPWRYDDGDQVVVFARRQGEGWRLDDNGEALFRLAGSGVDPNSNRVRARTAALLQLLGVHLADDGESLYATAMPEDLDSVALAVAEASAKVFAIGVIHAD